jgi:hypothetical protein
MSRSRLIRLCAPFAACVLVLQAYGCRDVRKADGDSPQPADLTLVNYSTHAKKPVQPAKAEEKKEAVVDPLPGACSQKDRDDYVHDASPKFTNQLRTCSKDTWAKNAKNFACLTRALPSLSEGCAQCYADMASCAKDNCKMACVMDSKSNKCIGCANANCQASLIKCTGVARADLP